MATDKTTSKPGGTGHFDAIAVARELGPTLAQRAAAHDADNTFVADSYADFKKRKLFSTGVPTELGGGGATFPELCAMVQEIGLRLLRARALDAHPRARDHRVVLEARRDRPRVSAPSRRRRGADSRHERRLRLAQRIGEGGEGRWRFPPVFSGRIALGLEPV